MRPNWIGIWGLGIAATIGLLPAATGGEEQSNETMATHEADPGVAPRFGTASLHHKSIHAVAFEPGFSSTTWDFFRGDERYCTAGGTFFNHGVDLPSGVLLESVSWVLFDDDVNQDIAIFFCKTPWQGGANSMVCLSVPATLSTPGYERPVHMVHETIDNETFSYWIAVSLGACSTNTTFRQARLAYRYQVSPPPGVATFGDVPIGHPQHQYIEALVASGITAGCGGGNYCPDAPLTRGQMAVFLSKGLGLHFEP